MNAERKRLVLESWEAIGRNHDGVAVAFYDRLFEIDSGARALFAKTNMVAQRAKFVQMLGDIVRNLDLPRELIPTVSRWAGGMWTTVFATPITIVCVRPCSPRSRRSSGPASLTRFVMRGKRRTHSRPP
jgi:hypothetical protein